VDEKRLLSALDRVYPDLTGEECKYQRRSFMYYTSVFCLSTRGEILCTVCQYPTTYMYRLVDLLIYLLVVGMKRMRFTYCLYITGERNTWGSDRLFVGIRHPSYSFLEGLYEGEKTTEVWSFFLYYFTCV
jgi:hypothetical protein